MFSNSKKKTEHLENKKNKRFSLLNRKQEGNSSSNPSLSIENDSNNRGWLEANNLQIIPSRSSESTSAVAAPNNKILKKDILGTVSDEDILKLTQLTSILPEISTSSSSNQHYHYHSHKKQTHYAKDTELPKPTPPPDASNKIPEPIEEGTTNYLKSYKMQSHNSSSNTEPKETLIVENNTQIKRRGRSNTQVVKEPTLRETAATLRRHSYDNFNTQIDEREWTPLPLMSADTITPLISIEEVKTLMFDYNSLSDDIKRLLEIYDRQGKLEIRKMTVKGPYDSNSQQSSISSTDDEQEEEDENNPNAVDYQDLIIGERVNYKLNPIRDIAILTTTASDNANFTKLIQLSPTNPGYFLDLRVSMFRENEANNDVEEDFSFMLEDVNRKLKAIDTFVQESDFSLQQQLQTLRSLNLFEDAEDKRSTLSRTYSQPSMQPSPEDDTVSLSRSSSISTTTSSSSGIIFWPTLSDTRNHRHHHRYTKSMAPDPTICYQKIKDPFRYRQVKIERLVKSLKSELTEFVSSLETAEHLVNDIQIDMDDFRNRMETYIKDIPESHYSTLRKLEVDIEFILSKRAKNPWLETGYALLSYLLTLFALFFWIIIYVLRMGEKIIKLPRHLWKEGSDYFNERDKKIRRASQLSVSVAEQHRPNSSLFQRRSQ